MGRSPRGDDGEATTQLVVLTPVILLLVLLVVQVALASYAAHVAEAAAARGADAAAVRGGSSTDGAQAVTEFLSGVATPTRAPIVTRDAASARAEVHVHVPRLVPFFPDEMVRIASAPVERFVPPAGR